MRKAQDYLELPWSINVEERSDDGDYLVARVRELPGLVATGESREELERSLWEAIEDHVRSYLEDGEEPPLPDGSREIFARTDNPYDKTYFVTASTVATQEKDALTKEGILRDRDRNLEPIAG